MLRIGAHMSVAGGVSKAVERAVVHGCEALQIFTKNANQWLGKPLDRAEIKLFRQRIEQTGITPVVSHASYLFNLATTFPALREQSIAAFIDEIGRAEALGLLGVVIHPGTCTAGPDHEALRLIADAIRVALKARPRVKTMVHLAAIITHLRGSRRVGICLDTCHLVASGYDITTEAGYRDTFEQFDRIVGIDRLKAFHGNDSKRPCGSRVDRHEHIGHGCIGLEPFRRLLHDARFAGLPILIETEKTAGAEKKGTVVADPFDMKNLDTLRRLRSQTY